MKIFLKKKHAITIFFECLFWKEKRLVTVKLMQLLEKKGKNNCKYFNLGTEVVKINVAICIKRKHASK